MVKTVLIAGSSIGIGRETAYLFAKEKDNVIITYYKDKKEAQLTEKKCKSLGASDTLLINLNVMDTNSIKKALETITKKYKKIDILVNNAGVIAWKFLSKQSIEEIENQIRTNLEGLIKTTKIFLPYINETIINISSGAGKTAYSNLSTYCATKFGVRGFTQSLAIELKKIRVYSVNPGMTKTRMTDFEGIPPIKVAEIILETAKTGYKKSSGSDIDVWEYT